MANNENDQAAKSLAEERSKLGFGPRKTKNQGENSELDDDDSDMGDLDDDESEEEDDAEEETTEDEDDSDDDSEDDSDEEEDEDEEEDDDSEEDQSRKKKQIPFKKYNQLRKDLRDANAKLKIQIEDNKKLEAKLPDDFEKDMDELVKDLGIQDPENMKKIVLFMKSVSEKSTGQIAKELADLKKQIADSASTNIVDEFPKEWKSFEKDFFSKEFPNATDSQKEEARKVMERLSHTKNIGGKAYIDDKGKEVLDAYPLDYIFYKNKDKFAALVTVKKKKGMESARTQGIKPQQEDDGEIQHLSKNSRASDIRKLDKKYANMEAGNDDGLRSPDNSTI